LGALMALVVASPNQAIRETMRSSIADLLLNVGSEYASEDFVELGLAVSELIGEDGFHSAINAVVLCNAY
jgi:hypothetical protein